MAKPEAPKAEGAVVEVQTQTAEQQNDRGSICPLHTRGQSPAEVLLVCTAADQELRQLEGPTSLTHLAKSTQRRELQLITVITD